MPLICLKLGTSLSCCTLLPKRIAKPVDLGSVLYWVSFIGITAYFFTPHTFAVRMPGKIKWNRIKYVCVPDLIGHTSFSSQSH